MEEFDDDDFSDLYADVEVQASSAISALHRSTELPPRTDRISAQGQNKAAEEGKGSAVVGGHLKYLSVENGDRCESRSASWSENESEDGSPSDGVERKVDQKYDDCAADVRSGVKFFGKEKSANAGDYSSQRKKQYNSLNSKTESVHERAQQVHKTCRKGDADDRSEDSSPNYGRKQEGHKFTPDRHEEANYAVPLDSDKRGSVQISDSVEGSPSEVSECDSDGMSETSNDTDRRKARCVANKVSSALEPESLERSWSQHGQDHSCSASRAALSGKYSEKCHMPSRYSSDSFRREPQDPFAQKYCHPRSSESGGVRRGTGNDRYHERWIDSTREHSNQPKRSNFNRPNDYSLYATDAKHPYYRHVNHGKQRDMVNLKYNEGTVPYYSHSERIMNYSDGHLPDRHLGPAFWKDQYWNIPNYRYEAGHPDGHDMNERQNYLDKKGSMDFEHLGYSRYHNQRRHPFHGDIKGVRNFSPKHPSAVDQRGTPFMHKGEGVHLRQTRQDFVSPIHDYDDRFVEGKYRRIHPCSGGARDRDHDRKIQSDTENCRYDQLVAHDRGGVDRSGRGKRRYRSPVSRENLCYIGTEVSESKNIKHHPFPFNSSEEPYASERGEFLGTSGPKFGVARRNMRCSWKEMCIESDQYGTDVTTFVARESLRYHPPEDFRVRRRDFQPSSMTNVTRESMRGNHYQNHVVGRRRNQQSEVRFPREDDEYKSRQQDNIVFGSEEPSRNLKRISIKDEADDRPAFCRITKLNKRGRGKRNSKLPREEDNSNHFDGCQESTKHNSHEQMHPSQQDSVDRLVFVDRKCTLQSSIRRTTEAGEDTYYGRSDLVGWSENKEPNNLEDLDGFGAEKAGQSSEVKPDSNLSNADKNQQSKFSKNKQDSSLEMEEGLINSEGMQNKDASEMNDNGVVEKLDDERIKEIMVKMERRRERFKEAVIMSKGGEKSSSLLVESSNVESDSAEARLLRPARKRRWLGR